MSTMTHRGKVTIPAALQRSFGAREGAAVGIVSTGTFAGVRPVEPVMQAPKSGFGLVKSKVKHAPADFDLAKLLAK
jgi:bifunctional DNA-binding transcriptional regulator/antitoxin component of YhaV-PrlF toxin-antitoxin module